MFSKFPVLFSLCFKEKKRKQKERKRGGGDLIRACLFHLESAPNGKFCLHSTTRAFKIRLELDVCSQMQTFYPSAMLWPCQVPIFIRSCADSKHS